MSEYKVCGKDEVCGELGFIVDWTADEYVFNFTVSRIHGRLSKDDSIEELEEVITGDIKWDGCANILYDNYMHYCDLEDFREQAEVLEWCYRKAKETILKSNLGEWE